MKLGAWLPRGAWLRGPGGRRLLLVFGVVVLAQAVILLAAFYPAPHNGGDNAGYLTLAHSLLERGDYLELWDPEEPPHTKYPPVFPLILAVAMLFGASSWIAFKSLSLGFTSAAVLLTYAWVAQRRGVVFAAGVALLFALSDALVWSSNWILSEPPFLAFTLLALWSFHRAAVDGGPGSTGPGGSAPAEGGGAADRQVGDPAAGPGAREAGSGEAARGGVPWLWIGCGAAILAYFTRSAGLPLVVAAALWLAGRRRWRALAVFLAAFGVPAFLWWLRARAVGDVSYVSEFWMVNPYDPAAGQAGMADLVSRLFTNFHLYVGTHVPRGILGVDLPLLTGFGYLFFLVAGAGWVRRLRREATVAELFLPLYFGLILLWPAVWSGDRFALPLYPLFLFYGGDLLLDGVRMLAARGAGGARNMRRATNTGEGWKPAGPARAAAGIDRIVLATGTAIFLLIAAPAAWAWGFAVQRASTCAALQDRAGGDPFACYPGPTGEFVAAARWSGEYLPEESVVFSRKPRLFYALSGVKSRMYPLSRDPDVFEARAREGGVGYLLVDYVDDVGPYYLFPVIQERPGHFCAIIAWGRPDGPMTELLGLTLPAPADEVAAEAADEVAAEPVDEAAAEAADEAAAEVADPDGAELTGGEGAGAAGGGGDDPPAAGATQAEGTVELSLAICDPAVVREVPVRPSLPLQRVPLLERARGTE